MSPEQIHLVRQSFAQVAPVAAQAGALFYSKLFARDPAIQGLFGSSDMHVQARKLLDMIGDAVRLLDHPERLDAALRALGQRHTGYGVQAAHYDTVGAALLETLSDALGGAFTPATREAWGAMYAHVARTMQAQAQLQH
ncbi:hemin receptor [Acidovorax sp. sif1233]|uniref:globin domain-containing protein n=1 Tax=unclassified Acidovorax TaxID=2684926 RepID=UPI001C438C8E|nr:MULTISPECIES: globin domain-containing protein [unclassified Acidovorax]MBV7430611.1 hemin receptor [Acidovorax sp. sif0732]MBV7449035.1 hemin receptor [Acidovorax sp. sif0715]MBV7456991.1 hemin receptor [Acidovorax sp. sif1233]